MRKLPSLATSSYFGCSLLSLLMILSFLCLIIGAIDVLRRFFPVIQQCLKETVLYWRRLDWVLLMHEENESSGCSSVVRREFMMMMMSNDSDCQLGTSETELRQYSSKQSQTKQTTFAQSLNLQIPGLMFPLIFV